MCPTVSWSLLALLLHRIKFQLFFSIFEFFCVLCPRSSLIIFSQPVGFQDASSHWSTCLPYDVCLCMCLCLCVAKSGRSSASITGAGTVGGPYVLARSNSFVTHSHLLAKKNSAVAPGEASPSYSLSFILIFVLLHHRIFESTSIGVAAMSNRSEYLVNEFKNLSARTKTDTITDIVSG